MLIIALFSLLFAFFAFYYLYRTFYCVRHRRVVRAGTSSVACVVSAALAAIGVMLVFSYLSYGRLIAEQPVSRISFEKLDGDAYQARVMIDGQQDRLYTLRGDEWQMDAKIITWEPPLTILGLDPLYRLERLSGRYSDIALEREAPRTVHAISPDMPVDLWRVARRFPLLLPGVDAHYGTATYVPMADGARYAVTLSRDALIARPENDAARTAVGNWTNRP